ncbi:MAG: GAF domain-containing protein [Deltaproteobacteria bacterium]|nr:GAF domain-containing protein [Deltaproteobacteria bacterium]
MLLPPALVAPIAFGYLLLLFGVAYWAERRKDRGRSLISNPYVYALSIAVYCTSWTFYGSVGWAARDGFSFLAVYLGPTLVAFSWWTLLRKMVRVARENHITSISDFVASRYSKSGKIGAFVTAMLIVGITPYIGLQLKAVSATFELLTQYSPGRYLQQVAGPGSLLQDTAFLVAVVLGIFGSMYGARTLDPSERHEGMVAAVALESLVKLGALLLVGAYVTWGLHDGLRDLLGRAAAHPAYAGLLTLGHSSGEAYTAWFSVLYLSSASVMLLPRQFHVMVVENCEEAHIREAMWVFPLYLFLINLFIVPIALAGLFAFGDAAMADTFVLRLPLAAGQPVIALIAFLGGLSAATGMVIVSSVTLSTMFLNHLVMPILLRLGWQRNFSPFLIHIKRLGIVGVLLIGYGYYRVLGETVPLVNMGLISFGAAAQLAPVVVGALFWRQATARGAATGLVLGFAAWAYMFLLPALCRAGWFPIGCLDGGPWGISLLKPTAFLGLDGLDLWSHGLFWSFLFNAGSFVAVSLFTRPSEAERRQIPRFVGALSRAETRPPEFRLAGAPSVGEFEELLAKFLGRKKAQEKIGGFFRSKGLGSPEGSLSDELLLELRGYVERTLAGAVGTAAASTVMDRYLALKGTTLEEIFDVFRAVSLSLEESREELGSRVRELSVLFEASKRVAATLEEQDAVEGVLDLIGSEFGLDCQGVFLLQDERLEPRLARGCSEAYLRAVAGPPDAASYLGRAVLERHTVFVSDASALSGPLPLEVAENRGMRSLIATPILREGGVLGVLVAGSRVRKGYFSEKFVEAFEALASELALALTNARLYAELRALNRTLEEKVRERTAELEAANRNLQELDRLKSEFLANMSHELRTPMNSILGYTQLVLDEVDGPVTVEQRESLRRVENNARHLLQLINDILDLSKIEAGRMELDLHDFDLAALAEEAVDDLLPLAQAKGLALTCEREVDRARVLADPNRVREVLNNLLNNAIKFTERGGVRVSVRAEGEGSEITVEDSGVGIPEGSLQEIFEAFKQLDGSSTRAHTGTGLGLSIAKKIVELHGGRMGVVSRVGEGSRFSVWLPRPAGEAGGG